jgi:hypothetical protein
MNTQSYASYKPMTEGPKEGFYACISLSEVLAQEIATAATAGTGAGMTDAFGVVAPGTIKPGTIVELDVDGTWKAGSSPAVSGGSAALPKALHFVHEGDMDLTARMVGKLVALRGLARFQTSSINGTSFTVGAPLIANAGNFEIKVLGDAKQIVGWVGPDGYRNGMLDVIFEACCWG